MRTMNIIKNLRKITISALIIGCSFTYTPAFAADNADDIDSMIQSQQQILAQLTQKKSEKNSKEILSKIDFLEKKINAANSSQAVADLSAQVMDLRAKLEDTIETQERIMALLEKLEKERKDEAAARNVVAAQARDLGESYRAYGSPATRNYLVNPGGQGSDVSYTQDAINSQGNSTMVFSYSPNQMYKIYCRRGFITDLSFKKGETISYVGGGDTASWSISKTNVDGVEHLLVKPVVETGTTNFFIATNKHTYQVIVNSSNWYNPMVTWVYGEEAIQENLLNKAKEERVVTGTVNAANLTEMDFNYEVSGKGNKPVMVFSDGEKTYLKFDKMNKKQVPIFIRSKNRKEMSLVSYTIKDKYMIIEKTFDIAQIRESDSNIITIKHKD
ncbi:TrbG/VirB9 family P-type conjugative transfer protein [Anaerovibrio sp.]|uniref:TrbG/VirB9 family P-type conjugative transfer protein n=1 Tax=Anaerovibrio sp. TaxID=1872532 RepID=UPI003F14AD91